MNRDEVRGAIIAYLVSKLPSYERETTWPSLQTTDILSGFQEQINELRGATQSAAYSLIKEIMQELVNAGIIFYGTPNGGADGYPLFTITTYGREMLKNESTVAYDPDGYIRELRQRVTC